MQHAQALDAKIWPRIPAKTHEMHAAQCVTFAAASARVRAMGRRATRVCDPGRRMHATGETVRSMQGAKHK